MNCSATLPFLNDCNLEEDVFIVPVSGGADSTALAILLKQVAPHLPYRYIFTDTHAEESQTYESLERLEKYLGQPIIRLGDRGLFELLDGEYNGYLPSPKARWCTKTLKLKPFQEYFTQFKGKRIWMFVGIRADEAGRTSFNLPGVETVKPFQDLGYGRAEVYSLLDKTIGIPQFYQTRTRSGCTTCFYQSKQELVGLYERNPIEFNRGAKYEALSEEYSGLFDDAKNVEGLSLLTGYSENHLSLPKPMQDIVVGGRKPTKNDLFSSGKNFIYIGAEFHEVDSGFETFYSKVRIVSYSTTLAGIKKQLQSRMKHLVGTQEVHDLNFEQGLTYDHSPKFAIYYMEAPDDLLRLEKPDKKCFTWHQGTSYVQIKSIYEWSKRFLNTVFLEQELAELEKRASQGLYVDSTEMASLNEAIIKADMGSFGLISSQWYEPVVSTEKRGVDKELICPMCQL